MRLGAPSGHSSIPAWILALPCTEYVFPWIRLVKQVRTELRQIYPCFWERALPREGSLCRDIKNTKNKSFFDKLGHVEVAFIIGSITDAATETPISPVLTFILLMVDHQDVQRRAQEEIDRVVGSERSPNWADWGALPFVRKCIAECLRW